MNLENTSIDVHIYLVPDEICKDYNKFLLQKVKDIYEKHAFEEHGIIYKVNKVNKIKSNTISDIGTSILFLVEIDIDRYLPKQDDNLYLPINKICPYGIFFLENKIRILIPSSSLNGYEMKKRESYYYIEKDCVEIRENGEIKLRLTEVRFEKDGFSCLGVL
jgi:DNA-directed RNA polymerase subunit E'/Rpb7